ncbi:MAG: YegP family protein [Methanosarcina barkeri]|nr:YegP family protein [Methanosarcina sp. ERenArc_MAG2]
MKWEDTIFRMRARNGQIIAVNQSYNNKENCLKGIQSVKSNAAGERIVIGRRA